MSSRDRQKQGHLGSLIGREREWKVLSERCERVRQGEGGLLLIEGEAGIGKSTLISHLSSWASSEGFQTISGTYIGHHRVPPLSGLREAISQLFSISSTDSRIAIEKKVHGQLEKRWTGLAYHRKEIVRFLAPFAEEDGPTFDRPFDKEENPEERIQRFYYFLCQLLSTAAEEAPLIIFLEDFHWADPATLDCIGYLNARFARGPVLLVAAYRPEEPMLSNQLTKLSLERYTQTLTVSPLDVEGVQRMAEPYGLGEHTDFCQRLREVSGGVPLFVEQWLNLWQEEPPPDPLSILSQIPHGVTQLIQRRFHSLAEREQVLLQVAAVLGDRFEPELVAQISGEPLAEVLDVLARVERRTFVHVVGRMDPRFVFHHDITRQVVYEEMPVAQRRILHGRAAEILEPLVEHQEERVFEVAHHYVAGHQSLKASQVLFLAGQRALALRAYEDAKSYYTQALQMLTEYPEEVILRAEINEALGDVVWETGTKESVWELVKTLWENALHGQGDILRRCTLNRKLGYTQIHQPHQRIRYFQKAIEESVEHPQSIERAQVLMDMMQFPRPDIADTEERARQAAQYAAQALRILRKHDPHKLLIQMLLINLPSIREKRIANMKRVRRLLHRAIRIADKLDDWESIILGYLRLAETWRGVDLELALQEGEKALAIAKNRYPGCNQETRRIVINLMKWSLAHGDQSKFAQYYVQLKEMGGAPVPLQEYMSPEDFWESSVNHVRELITKKTIILHLWYLSRLLRIAVETQKEKDDWKRFIADICETYGVQIAELGLKYLELMEVQQPEFPVERFQGVSVESLAWSDNIGHSQKDALPECNGKVIVPGPEVGLGWLNSAPSFLYSTSGDFVMEARISADTHPQRAGGLVVWQDHSQFIRFASGVDHIGQVSLGWLNGNEIRYVGVGYHPSRELVLKLVRTGIRYEGFVSPDGQQWFTCGDLEFGHKGPVEVGIFAECNYEYGFPQPFLVRFENVRLWVEKNESVVEEEQSTPSIKQPQIYPMPEVGEMFYGMVGRSRVFLSFCDKLKQLAPSTNPLLLCGETGVGKELAAQAVHELSGRGKRSFLRVNVTALPEELIESELFGYKKGAFTGANRNKPGLFVQVDGGSLFLDEIGELPLAVQPKLLRVLSEGEILPLGSGKVKKVDVRCIAATNRDLERKIVDEQFRDDLYYRLGTPVVVPPLRDRRDDIPYLVAHFIAQYSKGKSYEITREAMEQLMTYDWPGNVRELEHSILNVARNLDHEIQPKTKQGVMRSTGGKSLF